MQVNKVLHTCTSWYAYAAMFGSSHEFHIPPGGGPKPLAFMLLYIGSLACGTRISYTTAIKGLVNTHMIAKQEAMGPSPV